jgi:hypothetical protein
MVMAGVLLCSSASWAMDPSIRCQIDKLKLASKYTACRIKAAADAVKRFGSADFSPCDESFLAAWELAEARTISRGVPCWTTGDGASVQAAITAYTDNLANSLDRGQ